MTVHATIPGLWLQHGHSQTDRQTMMETCTHTGRNTDRYSVPVSLPCLSTAHHRRGSLACTWPHITTFVPHIIIMHLYFAKNRQSRNKQTRSIWSKISGRRGRLPSIIFTRILRPMNALQLCRWQFTHKETL